MEAFRGCSGGDRTCYSTWRKLGRKPGLFEAFRDLSASGQSWSGDQVLWKLSGVEFRWHDLLQHLEEVGAKTRSCGSFQGLKFGWQDSLQHPEEVGMATRLC